MRRPIDTLELACFGWSRESLYCLALLPPSSILQVLLGIERLVFTVELHSVSCSMLNYMSHPSLIAISTRTQLQQSCVQCCGGTVQHLWSAKVWNSIDICSPREGHSGYTSFKVQDQRRQESCPTKPRFALRDILALLKTFPSTTPCYYFQQSMELDEITYIFCLSG